VADHQTIPHPNTPASERTRCAVSTVGRRASSRLSRAVLTTAVSRAFSWIFDDAGGALLHSVCDEFE